MLPYLLLNREDSAYREHDLRAVFNGVPYKPILRNADQLNVNERNGLMSAIDSSG